MKPLSVEDGTGKLCKYCDLPIRETHMGRVRNEWEHMTGLSFCADGKHWAWPNTKGVEDGIVCEFCGTHCYHGAEHNARVEDNAKFNDPQPAVPVEERTAPTFTDSQIYDILDRLNVAGVGPQGITKAIWKNGKVVDVVPDRWVMEFAEAIHDLAQAAPIPEERTAEMEPAEVLHCDNGDYMVYIPCGIEIAHCRDEKIANWIRDKWNPDHIEGKGK